MRKEVTIPLYGDKTIGDLIGEHESLGYKAISVSKADNDDVTIVFECEDKQEEIRSIQKTMGAVEAAFDRMNNPHKYEAWQPCPKCGEYAPCVRSMTVVHRRSDDVLLAYLCKNGHRFRKLQEQTGRANVASPDEQTQESRCPDCGEYYGDCVCID